MFSFLKGDSSKTEKGEFSVISAGTEVDVLIQDSERGNVLVGEVILANDHSVYENGEGTNLYFLAGTHPTRINETAEMESTMEEEEESEEDPRHEIKERLYGEAYSRFLEEEGLSYYDVRKIMMLELRPKESVN